jgi:DNA-directed RNA polymerase specialized sigma24 family protein
LPGKQSHEYTNTGGARVRHDPLADAELAALGVLSPRTLKGFQQRKGYDMNSDVQNKFTAYLQTALIRQRLRHAQKISAIAYYEMPFDSELVCVNAADSEAGFFHLDMCPLSEHEHSILLLHVMAQMRYAEISLLLGISIATAQKVYQRAIPKLRAYLEEQQYEF